MPKYAELVYNGFWFSPEREALQALVDKTQEFVTGTVRLKLYKVRGGSSSAWASSVVKRLPRVEVASLCMGVIIKCKVWVQDRHLLWCVLCLAGAPQALLGGSGFFDLMAATANRRHRTRPAAAVPLTLSCVPTLLLPPFHAAAAGQRHCGRPQEPLQPVRPRDRLL
jgi:hypothetical protein